MKIPPIVVIAALAGAGVWFAADRGMIPTPAPIVSSEVGQVAADAWVNRINGVADNFAAEIGSTDGNAKLVPRLKAANIKVAVEAMKPLEDRLNDISDDPEKRDEEFRSIADCLRKLTKGK